MSTLRKTPRELLIDGMRYSVSFLPENVRSAMRYQPKESDIFVAAFPKCGTTWMVQIVLLILRKELPTTSKEYSAANIYLEFGGADAVNRMEHPGLIKTHLPLHQIPFSPRAKYIYVARHPGSCCVSFYHHTKFFPLFFFSDGNFEDYFDLFVTGRTVYNDYFDHLIPWYESRNEANVFFTTFERMKADHRGTVVKVAEFLGAEYLEAIEKDNDLLNKIVHRSSFEFMKGYLNDWMKAFATMSSHNPSDDISAVMRTRQQMIFEAIKEGHRSVGDFIRTGSTEEWKTVLTSDQHQRLNERIQEKTRYSDVMSLWN